MKSITSWPRGKAGVSSSPFSQCSQQKEGAHLSCERCGSWWERFTPAFLLLSCCTCLCAELTCPYLLSAMHSGLHSGPALPLSSEHICLIQNWSARSPHEHWPDATYSNPAVTIRKANIFISSCLSPICFLIGSKLRQGRKTSFIGLLKLHRVYASISFSLHFFVFLLGICLWEGDIVGKQAVPSPPRRFLNGSLSSIGTRCQTEDAVMFFLLRCPRIRAVN